MTTLVYDNTFYGFLTAVFEVYEYKLNGMAEIVPERRPQASLFGDSRVVQTDNVKAGRVWDGLGKRLDGKARMDVYKTFLSELEGMEQMVLHYITYAIASGDVSKDFSNAAVLYIAETAKKVHREKHRMEAFVRFRQTADNIYAAFVEPDFNVLPLIADHFEKRYADQQWLIYDLRRKYGIYYDLQTVSTVDMTFAEDPAKLPATSDAFDKNEAAYEELWRNYFRSVNIASRKNVKLHRQHMPLRYWKYLTEKQ